MLDCLHYKRVLFWGSSQNRGKGMQKICMSFLCMTFICGLAAEQGNNMVVVAPVADLRSCSQRNTSTSFDKIDWKQGTQLLYGEKIVSYEQKQGWLRVKALEQKVFAKGQWRCCVGWIRANQAKRVKQFTKTNLTVTAQWATVVLKDRGKVRVCLGSRLKGLRRTNGHWSVRLPTGEIGYIKADMVNYYTDRDQGSIRKKEIIETAKTFLGAPYFWGGRSPFSKGLLQDGQRTSVDCSALVNLCYRAHGIDLARNSPSIYKQSRKLSGNPEVGDLIFFSRSKNPKDICHVMLCAGNDQLIEAKGKTVRIVRQITATKLFGKKISQLKSGDLFRNKELQYRYLFFGSIDFK